MTYATFNSWGRCTRCGVEGTISDYRGHCLYCHDEARRLVMWGDYRQPVDEWVAEKQWAPATLLSEAMGADSDYGRQILRWSDNKRVRLYTVEWIYSAIGVPMPNNTEGTVRV